MSERLRLEGRLDAAAPVVLAAVVVAAAAGSSVQFDISRAGGPARWALIAVLFAFAALRARSCGGDWHFPPWTGFALAAFCGLSLVSTTWSVNAHGTLERAVVQPVVVAALALLAGCAAARPRLAVALLDGVVLAAAVVALAGFVYWLLDPSRATIPVSVQYPSRYQGVEENPDTAPLLLAIAMPIAFWRCLGGRDALRRALFLALLLAFAASISASGSRGGLAAGFLGLLAVAVLAPRARRPRLALATLVVLGLVICAWATTIPKALPASQAPPTQVASTPNAELVLPQSEEIGNPWWTHRNGRIRRALFDTSVRGRALRGAVDRALERPIMGFGFGAEKWAFVNRYYGFGSQNPENGYAGILLQLGVVGLALWLVVLCLCVVPVLLAFRRGRPPAYAVGAVGAAAAALGMGLSQSYFHGPGSIGYVALWTSLMLTAVAGARLRGH